MKYFLLINEQPFQLTQSVTTIGKSSENTIQINDNIDDYQALIFIKNDQVIIKNSGSKTVYVNHYEIDEQNLYDNDLIMIGDTCILFFCELDQEEKKQQQKNKIQYDFVFNFLIILTAISIVLIVFFMMYIMTKFNI